MESFNPTKILASSTHPLTSPQPPNNIPSLQTINTTAAVMPSFNPYRSARNRRWHSKRSLSPRKSSAPVADTAITGTTLSPAARLMAATAPPSPTRNALPSAARPIAEAAPPSPSVAAPAAVFTAPFAVAAVAFTALGDPADAAPADAPTVSAAPALAAPAAVMLASFAPASTVDTPSATAASTLAAPAAAFAVASAAASIDTPPMSIAPAFTSAAAAVVPSVSAPVDVGGNTIVPASRLIVGSASARTRSPSPTRRSPVDPSGAYEGQFSRHHEPINASPTKNSTVLGCFKRLDDGSSVDRRGGATAFGRIGVRGVEGGSSIDTFGDRIASGRTGFDGEDGEDVGSGRTSVSVSSRCSVSGIGRSNEIGNVWDSGIVGGGEKERVINIANSDGAGDVEMAPPPYRLVVGMVQNDVGSTSRTGDNSDASDSNVSGDDDAGPTFGRVVDLFGPGQPDVFTVEDMLRTCPWRKYFETTFRFQFACSNGWVTVLDPIDDLLMYHDIVFLSQDKTDIEGYHVAWVFRWLTTAQDFFVETSGLRRTESMMQIHGDKDQVDDKFPERVRGILL